MQFAGLGPQGQVVRSVKVKTEEHISVYAFCLSVCMKFIYTLGTLKYLDFQIGFS